jgi:hypothetical protein
MTYVTFNKKIILKIRNFKFFFFLFFILKKKNEKEKFGGEGGGSQPPHGLGVVVRHPSPI